MPDDTDRPIYQPGLLVDLTPELQVVADTTLIPKKLG